MGPKLEIVLAHHLPDRVRLRLSHPLKAPGKAVENIQRHDGIRSAVYTPATQNILIAFDSGTIALEEIIIRTSLAYSAGYGLVPTTIKASQPTTALTGLSFLSALALAAGHLLRLVASGSSSSRTVELLSGLGTLTAVLEHTYSDLKQAGRFHPEVLSLGYLLVSFIRGNPLRGATIAWITTFARHLLEPPVKELRIEAEAIDPECDANHCEYEAKVSNRPPSAAPANLLARLPGFLAGLYRDANVRVEDRIFREIWNLSENHETVLEGLETIGRGIRLNIVP
jgi:hypothetical protein